MSSLEACVLLTQVAGESSETKKLPHFGTSGLFRWFLSQCFMLNNFILKQRHWSYSTPKKHQNQGSIQDFVCWSPQHWATTEVQGKMLQCRVAFSSTSPGFHTNVTGGFLKLICFLFFGSHPNLEWLQSQKASQNPGNVSLNGSFRHQHPQHEPLWHYGFNYHLAITDNNTNTNTATLITIIIITTDIHSHPAIQSSAPRKGTCQWAIPQRPSFAGLSEVGPAEVGGRLTTKSSGKPLVMCRSSISSIIIIIVMIIVIIIYYYYHVH